MNGPALSSERLWPREGAIVSKDREPYNIFCLCAHRFSKFLCVYSMFGPRYRDEINVPLDTAMYADGIA